MNTCFYFSTSCRENTSPSSITWIQNGPELNISRIFPEEFPSNNLLCPRGTGFHVLYPLCLSVAQPNPASLITSYIMNSKEKPEEN